MIDSFQYENHLIRSIVLVVLITVSISGCNSSGPDGRRPFSGSVSFDGTSVDGGSIAFESINSSGTNQFRSGAILQKGTFTVGAQDGLPPGEYMVKIYWPERHESPVPSSTQSSTSASPPQSTTNAPNRMNDAYAQVPDIFRRPPAKERIPAKYNTKSELRVTIQEKGKNHFVFELQSSE